MRLLTKSALPGIVLLAALAVSSCGSQPAAAAPALNLDNINTAVAQTEAALADQVTATTPPTLTPIATITPMFVIVPNVPASNSNGGAAQPVCDNAVFVADVTIPDNTVVAAGKPFKKTWTLQNTGTCAWSSTYTLSFASGEAMGGVSTPIGAQVSPGSQANVSINLTAPQAAGKYTGYWRLVNAQGAPFGESVYVLIVVSN